MYQWTDDLSVNDATIDSQHQELFRAINQLMEAMRTGQGATKALDMVEFLSRYVVDHFSLEERYMTTNSYPDYLAHKAEHERFMQDLAGIKKMVEDDRATIAVLLEVQQSTCDWLKNHIKASDKALGDYLRKSRAVRP